MEEVNIGLAFAAGLLSFVSPCVLPLVPAYIGYMGGRATRNVALEKGKNDGSNAVQAVSIRANMLLHGLSFVLGFTLVFVVLGLMTTAFVSALGGSANMLQEIIGRVGGVVIIIFGLHFMGAIRWLFNFLKRHPALLNNILSSLVIGAVTSLIAWWAFVAPLVALPIIAAIVLSIVLGGGLNKPGEFWLGLITRFENAIYADTRRDFEMSGKEGLGGSFFMGVVFSAGWTPCIGPLYGAILTVAANTGAIGQAVPLLTAYSLGLGIPFMLTALLFEGAQSILRRLQRHMHKIEIFSGVLLIVIGILVASGQLQRLSTSLSTEQAAFSYRVEECGIAFLDGRLHLNQVGSCLGGSLHLVAIGQSLSGTLNAEIEQAEYVFQTEEAGAVIAIEWDRLRAFSLQSDENTGEQVREALDIALVDEAIQIEVKVLDSDGNEYATSNSLELIEDDEYQILGATELGDAGQYTVMITNNSADDIEVSFRLRVVESEITEVVDLTGQGENESGALTGLATRLDSIETLADDAVAVEGLDVGNRAPDFTVTTINGETVSLSDLRGQTVLLNFWGTWCGPCRREMPDFQAVYEEYSDKGFTILALAVGGDTEADVIEFRDEFGLTFPLAVDEGDIINDQYGIISQPSTLILDEDGEIIFKNFGLVMESQLRDILLETLNLDLES